MQRLLYAVSFPLLGNYNKTFAKTLYLARKLRYILCDQKKINLILPTFSKLCAE